MKKYKIFTVLVMVLMLMVINQKQVHAVSATDARDNLKLLIATQDYGQSLRSYSLSNGVEMPNTTYTSNYLQGATLSQDENGFDYNLNVSTVKPYDPGKPGTIETHDICNFSYDPALGGSADTSTVIIVSGQIIFSSHPSFSGIQGGDYCRGLKNNYVPDLVPDFIKTYTHLTLTTNNLFADYAITNAATKYILEEKNFNKPVSSIYISVKADELELYNDSATGKFGLRTKRQLTCPEIGFLNQVKYTDTNGECIVFVPSLAQFGNTYLYFNPSVQLAKITDIHVRSASYKPYNPNSNGN